MKRHEEADYEEAVAIEPDGDLDDGEPILDILPDSEPAPASPSPRPSRPRRFGLSLFHRLALHLTLLLVVGALLLTVVMSLRVRHLLYEQDTRTALAVYTAASHFISAHYKMHEGKLKTPELDSAFKQYLIHRAAFAPPPRGKTADHGSSLILYGPEGKPLYRYPSPPSTETPRPLLAERPTSVHHRLDHDAQQIHIVGPVASADEVVGYLQARLPSFVTPQIRNLYMELGLLALLVIVGSVVLSLVFVRHELGPVTALSRAAEAVSRGDLSQRVDISKRNELGELAGTFNAVLESLSLRISLMRRMQEGIVRIGRQLDSEQLHQALAQAFASIGGATACRLYLCPRQKSELIVGAECGPGELPSPAADSLTLSAFEERWAHYLKPNGQRTEDPAEATQLAIPMLSGTHRNGVIRMGAQSDGSRYDAETVSALHTLAQFASVAIENAELYGQLTAQQRIEQEMLWARNIQQSMLPHSTPALPGYAIYGGSVPANEVGGDYFDYVHGTSTDWHIIIGDVAGKGVPAALIMSIVRSLMHTYMEFESSPATILNLVNRSLSADLDTDMFVTLSSIQLDPDRNVARVARAGHEPVLILRSSGDIERIAPSGVALGLLDVERFQHLMEESEIELRQDDTLVLYTDGITEAQNRNHEDFGQERLEEVMQLHAKLPPHELYNEITREVAAYSAGMPQLDDITLVVLHRNGA